MRIGWIQTLNAKYGGNRLDTITQSVLSQHSNLRIFDVSIDNFKTIYFPFVLWKLSKLEGHMDLWIRQFDSMLTLPIDKTEGKNLALIYHIDISVKPVQFQIPAYAIEKLFYRNLQKADAIVTISKYWKRHFEKLNYCPVYTIYNPFDFSHFQFTEEEIDEFKRKYRLEGKPIIYLGNCQRAKGVVEAYQQLKDMDAFLVTSGKRDVDIPAINLDLSYRDYLRLLKASSVVVTMSKFKEGWCRTAHEALLCKTPVVGSGLGGMGELLEEARQIKCPNFDELRPFVEYLLEHPEIGQKGYQFARDEKFSTTTFSSEWRRIIDIIGFFK